MASSWDAVVIGAGSNGLTSACVLGKAGLRTLLVEEREEPGGQGRLVEFAPGFHAAPLGVHCGWLPPWVAKGIGVEVGRAHPSAPLSVTTGEGETLSLWSDPERAADALRRHCTRDAHRWPEVIARLRTLAGFLATLYELPAFDVGTTSPREALSLLGVGRRLRGLGRADMTEILRVLPMSAQELVEDAFETPPLRAVLAAGGVRDLRQGPRSGGTAFVLLHGLIGAPAGVARDAGWWSAGPDAFTKAALNRARATGVEVRTGSGVEGIVVRDDAVAGVVLSGGEEVPTTRVVSTADPVRTLLGLVDPVWLDPELLRAVGNIKLRGSTTVVAYGLGGLPSPPGGDAAEVLRGVLSLTPEVTDLERAADAAKYGRVSERPHVELTSPTCRWPDGRLAPGGKHVLVATARWTPYSLGDGAWDGARREAVGDRVDAVIEEALSGFRELVEHRAVFTPRDIAERWGLTEGAATQGEPMLDQILFMRPVPALARHATPIRGLYLGGCGTHPGPGVVGGAGWLAARRVLADS